jgi:dipeptidyl aminopeptidase/acylaminoacyl peptidase
VTDIQLIPLQVLFGDPAVCAPSLSPSGSHLTFLAPSGGELNVWIGSVRDRDFHPLTDGRGAPVEEYVWARDGRHLLYLSDRDGDERAHLIAVDLRTGATRDLTPYAGVRVAIVGMQSTVPDQVLVAMNRRAADTVELFRLRLADGGHELVETGPGLTGWLTDPQLRVRVARRAHDDGGFTIVVRDDEASPWRSLLRLGYEDAADSQLLGFTGDGRHLLLLSPLGSDTARLLKLCATTGSIEVLYGEPDFDVVSASLHPITGQPDLAVVERDRTVLVPLADDTAEDLRRIQARSRGDVTPLGRDLNNERWLVQDNIDTAPAAYCLFERATGETELLFTHNPRLDAYTLATVEPFTFPARDGLTIHGYLTFPPGQRHGLPAVVNVHGGPWERNRWGLRAESQWLANRGYLCVEVNYRGSTGFGRAFSLAGDREWGGRMQDDLLDAVRWVVDHGYADPDRIAISGASYGGYAALVGAAFTPEVFRCAVAVAAPANLQTFVASVPGSGKPGGSRIARRVGDPDRDAELLWSRSPLSRVADIRIPLLLAYGRHDPRVPISEAEQLVKALRANAIEHRCVIFEDEGHGFAKPHNTIAFHAMAEQFLSEHLGGRCEPA